MSLYSVWLMFVFTGTNGPVMEETRTHLNKVSPVYRSMNPTADTHERDGKTHTLIWECSLRSNHQEQATFSHAHSDWEKERKREGIGVLKNLYSVGWSWPNMHSITECRIWPTSCFYGCGSSSTGTSRDWCVWPGLKLFQHDSDPAHNSKSWFTKFEVEEFRCPAQSLDLWTPVGGTGTPGSCANTLEAEWAQIRAKIGKKSLSRTVEAVIAEHRDQQYAYFGKGCYIKMLWSGVQIFCTV